MIFLREKMDIERIKEEGIKEIELIRKKRMEILLSMDKQELIRFIISLEEHIDRLKMEIRDSEKDRIFLRNQIFELKKIKK